MNNFSGNIVDIINKKIFPGTIYIENGKIHSVVENESVNDLFIMPGFVDSHVHIESSMLVPSEFARLASVHGTVAVVSDPHEIANVLGIEGIDFMIKNGNSVPFKFYFGAPSCVPATSFETSGASITSNDVHQLLSRNEIKYLSEMMNFPGVIFEDKDVLKKINSAKFYGKPIDGHAPGLNGEQLEKYISAGISTDHEATELNEAIEKINLGMKILIREGSAAKNFDNLQSIIGLYTDMVMFCSDDKHPDSLLEGHINLMVKKALLLGYDLFDVLRIATLNPIEHYKLDVGLLRTGDDADFIIVDNLTDLNVKEVFVKGIKIAENHQTLINTVNIDTPNIFNLKEKFPMNFFVKPTGQKLRVIESYDGSLFTGEIFADETIIHGNAVSNVAEDILKIAVVNRYIDEKPSVGFIKGFGLKTGAIATSVAHDSHNIIAVGTTDNEICRAVNAIIRKKGGLCVCKGTDALVLPLPVGGLMSNLDAYETAGLYSEINQLALELGSPFSSPFMTLSFMALLVIPKLKLSNKGLFDGERFEFVSLHV